MVCTANLQEPTEGLAHAPQTQEGLSSISASMAPGAPSSKASPPSPPASSREAGLGVKHPASSPTLLLFSMPPGPGF